MRNFNFKSRTLRKDVLPGRMTRGGVSLEPAKAMPARKVGGGRDRLDVI